MSFNIEVGKPEVRHAFALLRHNIGMLNWFAANNRPYQENFLRGLNNPLINAMIEDCGLITSETYRQFDARYFDAFVEELYSKCSYDEAICKIKEFIPKISKAETKFKALHDSWGFKIYDKYVIDLDYFGSGGKYFYQTGHVTVGIKGGVPTDEKIIGLILHEMIHLGIQELIVNRFNLPQEEKERIVDNLCVYVLDGIVDSKRMRLEDGTMTAYQPVAECAAYMDDVVGIQPKNNLVKAVEAFINNEEKNKIRYIRK